MSGVVVGIACEDHGHFSAVTGLVDRALTRLDWMDGNLEHCRAWSGIEPGRCWYKYDPDDASGLRGLTCGGRRIPMHGRIGGEPLKPEARMWRKTLGLFCGLEPCPAVVVLARDLDGRPERREGLEQVRDGLPWPFQVVAACAEPEVEAWRVAGFVPGDDGERRTLAEVERDLCFDPTTSSHRLTSHPNDARTDAKRVLARLCDGDPDREAACLADRALLHDRGADNGLADFLDEIETRLLPVFGSTP